MKTFKRIQLLLLTCCSTLNFFAQLNFEYAPNDIPVSYLGQNLYNPFGGGFNYAQISDLDVDYDGDLDLVIFDRTTNNIRVYESLIDNSTPVYRQMYNARLMFPQDILFRLYFADYDNDGNKDLFTSSIGGMSVYRNSGDQTNGLQWTLIANIVKTDYFGNYTNLYIPSSDIPAIIDVEGDGDLDILTFGINGVHVEYHQNQSMELYGHSDSLIFVLKNACWGKFGEDFNTNTILLNDTSSECNAGNVPNPQKSSQHAGSTILALDYNNNNVLDLIIGDISYSNLTLLINGGTTPNTNSAMISQDNAFPSSNLPVNLDLFPAAFYLDVDFDGIKDLVVSGNAKNISQNVSSIYFYKNNGSNNAPNFSFQTKALFQEDMLEVGTGSLPQIVDIDKDGLEDLIIGNFFRYKPTLSKESNMHFYKNTGTASAPVYTFIDDDFLNLSSASFGLRLSPAFGDIDNDGDQDLILGKDDGKLLYFQNTSVGSSPTFAPVVLDYKDVSGNAISVGQYASPQLFDLNEDGKLDLIIGNKNGLLSYYQNTGSLSIPQFTLVNNNLGGVNVSDNLTPNGYATPHFFKNNDTLQLFVGSYDGMLHYYKDIENNLGSGALFSLYSPNFLNVDIQGYSSFFTSDLDGDGLLNMFAGQDLGGIYHFEIDPNSTVNLNEQKINNVSIFIFPNPNDGIFSVKIDGDVSVESMTIYHNSGVIVYSGAYDPENKIDLSKQANGVYFLQLNDSESKVYIRKIILI